jgi:hypothetical protein
MANSVWKWNLIINSFPQILECRRCGPTIYSFLSSEKNLLGPVMSYLAINYGHQAVHETLELIHAS